MAEKNPKIISELKHSLENMKITTVNLDEKIHIGDSIQTTLTNEIQKADIIIADVSGKNPGVDFEVGYASGIGKPIIFLAEVKTSKVPVYTSGKFLHFYDLNKPHEVKNVITKAVESELDK